MSPRLVPLARIPAPPLLSGLSKVLRGPSRGAREVSLPCPGLFPSAPSRPSHPGGQGALGYRPAEPGAGSFNTHLLGIFVHPAPGTRDAPDGLFGHS